MMLYRELEEKVLKILIKDGYIGERARYNAKQIKGHWVQHKLDFFHCFDIIALKIPEPVRFIQVCVEGQVKQHKDKIDELFLLYPFVGDSFTVEIIVPEKIKNKWVISKIYRRLAHDWVSL